MPPNTASATANPSQRVSKDMSVGPLDLLQSGPAAGSHSDAAGVLNVAIVGAGICGMCTAITLAERGHHITLYERDGSPPAGGAETAFFEWKRSGAGQFRHPHAFLGLVCNLLAERYPQLLEQLFAAGARKVDFSEMLPYALREHYQPQPGDEALWVLMCRRATMETVIRKHVESLPGVRIVSGVTVTGLIAQPAGPGRPLELQGLYVDRDQAVHADVVVDASGRTSRLPRMLADLGVEIPEEKEDAEILYYTRHYRLQPGAEEPPRGKLPGAGDLGYLKFGVFPGEDGHFAIILCIPVQELALKKALRDGDQFDRICRSIPGLAPWLEEQRSAPTTDSFGIADIHAVWRDYAPADAPLVHNFFAVGDAHVRTNPLYGRGCSTGVLHAAMLADVLAGAGPGASADEARARALAFEQLTLEGVRPIYDASLSEDRKGKSRALALREGRNLDRAKSLKQYLGLAFGDALSAAAVEQVHVVRGLMRTVNLLEKPGAFLEDSQIKRTLLRYMLRGRRRNAASRLQPGPDRDAMHQRVLAIDGGGLPNT